MIITLSITTALFFWLFIRSDKMWRNSEEQGAEIHATLEKFRTSNSELSKENIQLQQRISDMTTQKNDMYLNMCHQRELREQVVVNNK